MNRTKIIPGFALALGALIWVFRHLSAPTQQILAYLGLGLVFAVVMGGLWRFRATPERTPESPDQPAH
jgi:membrane protein CcdC involved in cytochrome C biogenesis